MEEKSVFKEKMDHVKDQAMWKAHRVREWCSNHKAELVVFGPVLITFTADMIKTVTKKGTVKEERRLKDNYVYDDKNRHYYELRRKLKSSEWIQIDHRKANGELLGDILQDMRVLK